MNYLDRLSPLQRQLLMFGLPVVAVFALLQRRSPAPDPAADPAAPPAGSIPGTMPTDAMLGTGAASEWFSNYADLLGGLTDRVKQIEKDKTTPPAPTSPPKALYGGAPPKTADGHQDPQLGKRTTTVTRNPLGQTETLADVARRVYTSGTYWQYLVFFNASKLPQGASSTTRPLLGTALAY